MNNNINHNIIVVGAGPAGIACAIQLKRFARDVAIIEKNRIGGLLNNANIVENYPGFPFGISGMELCNKMAEHLKCLDIPIYYDNVINLSYKDNFLLESEKTQYSAEYLVLACGTIPKKLMQIDNSDIHYDLQNLINIKSKSIIIIGGGDAAFDYALNMSINNQISIIHRNENFSALRLLIDRANKNSNIKIYKSYIIEEISHKNGKKIVNCISSDGKKETIECDDIIVAIGREPDLSLIETMGLNDKIEQKIFKIGDLCNGRYRQATISVGDGMKTAMMIENLIVNGNESNSKN